jgi:predicted AlkP superfamily phosphohydrolase/phosphomutase
VPLTYPVKPVNGFMVSGWMTPYTARDYVYPPELGDELRNALGDYRIYPTMTCTVGHERQYLEASIELLEMRTRTALYLLGRERWDFFMTVLFDTDRVLHQLWHTLDPEHPWHAGQSQEEHRDAGLVLEYFRHVDRCLGRLFEAAGDDGPTGDGVCRIVMSDHGMGSAHNFVVLNNWLLESGFLRLQRTPWTGFKHLLFRMGITLRNVHKLANRLGLAKHAEYKGLYSTDWLLKLAFLSFNDVDWSQSLAYSFGRHYGPVYVNVRGREPRGIVEPGAEYERVREQIIAAALEFRHPRSGRKMVGRVLRREDVYHGPHLEHAPDLILVPADPHDIFFGLADFGSNRVVDTVYRYSGMHRDYGMLMMAGPQVAAGTQVEDATIADLTPTLLHLMGLPIPEDMDGRALVELLAPAYREHAPRRVATQDLAGGERVVFDEHEEGQIAERLRGLGYLG